MRRLFQLLMAGALVLAFVACNGEPPPPPGPCDEAPTTWPECENTEGVWVEDGEDCFCDCPGEKFFQESVGCQCPDTAPIWNPDDQTCNPEEPPPPVVFDCSTPVGLRECPQYIRHDRADDLRDHILVLDQALIWNGYRHPRFAALRCPEKLPDGSPNPNTVFPWDEISQEEALAISEEVWPVKVALTGEDGESGFYSNLFDDHHRCDPTKWTKVYGPCLDEWMTKAKLLVYGCKEWGEDGKCDKYNPGSQADGPVARLDGIGGACKALVEVEVTGEEILVK